MKARSRTTFLLGFLAVLLLAMAASGCGVHTFRTGVVVSPAPVVVAHPAVLYQPVPPPRIYYGGHWLYYRGDAYYYPLGSTWIVASSVPVHVARYHRPYAYHSGYFYTPGHYYRGHGSRYHWHYYRPHHKVLTPKVVTPELHAKWSK